jgi:hypothetical protein
VVIHNIKVFDFFLITMVIYQNWVFKFLILQLSTLIPIFIPNGGLMQFLILTPALILINNGILMEGKKKT